MKQNKKKTSTNKLFIQQEIPALPYIQTHELLSDQQTALFLSDVIENQEGIIVHHMLPVSRKEKNCEVRGKLMEVTLNLPEGSPWGGRFNNMSIRTKIFIPEDHYEYCYFAEHCMDDGEMLS